MGDSLGELLFSAGLDFGSLDRSFSFFSCTCPFFKLIFFLSLEVSKVGAGAIFFFGFISVIFLVVCFSLILILEAKSGGAVSGGRSVVSFLFFFLSFFTILLLILVVGSSARMMGAGTALSIFFLDLDLSEGKSAALDRGGCGAGATLEGLGAWGWGARGVIHCGWEGAGPAELRAGKASMVGGGGARTGATTVTAGEGAGGADI